MQLTNTLIAFSEMISRFIADGYQFTPLFDVRTNGPYIELVYEGNVTGSEGTVARFDTIQEAYEYYVKTGVAAVAEYKDAILEAFNSDTQPLAEDPFVPVNGDDISDLPVNGSGDMILIENIETGERQYIYPNDAIPDGWILVYTADTGIRTLFPWLIFGTIFFMMTAKR